MLLGLFEVAFAGPQPKPAHQPLPLLSGEALRRWSNDLARQVVDKYARRPRTSQTPVELAHEIEGLASEAISDSLQVTAVRHVDRCNQCSRETIGVTAPEALAIVDDLSHRLSRRELQEFRTRVEANAEQAAAQDCVEGGLVMAACPLLSQGGCCLSYEARPLYCRGHWASYPPHNGPLTADRPDLFAATVGQGVREGLQQGLAAAGWDGHVYELNTALATALASPDAASRWAQGEAMFASCRQIEPVAGVDA
jgi:Fe-S-cluster containining protein